MTTRISTNVKPACRRRARRRRVAEFYEAKLQRTLDRVVGIAGPAAIIVISIVVGGLIVSVMTALMSVSQIIG